MYYDWKKRRNRQGREHSRHRKRNLAKVAESEKNKRRSTRPGRRKSPSGFFYENHRIRTAVYRYIFTAHIHAVQMIINDKWRGAKMMSEEINMTYLQSLVGENVRLFRGARSLE